MHFGSIIYIHLGSRVKRALLYDGAPPRGLSPSPPPKKKCRRGENRDHYRKHACLFASSLIGPRNWQNWQRKGCQPLSHIFTLTFGGGGGVVRLCLLVLLFLSLAVCLYQRCSPPPPSSSLSLSHLHGVYHFWCGCCCRRWLIVSLPLFYSPSSLWEKPTTKAARSSLVMLITTTTAITSIDGCGIKRQQNYGCCCCRRRCRYGRNG